MAGIPRTPRKIGGNGDRLWEYRGDGICFFSPEPRPDAFEILPTTKNSGASVRMLVKLCRELSYVAVKSVTTSQRLDFPLTTMQCHALPVKRHVFSLYINGNIGIQITGQRIRQRTSRYLPL